MIEVEFRQEGSYRIKMGKPERRLVDKVAAEFGITKTAAVTSIFYRGYDSLVRQIQDSTPKEGESHGCPHSG